MISSIPDPDLQQVLEVSDMPGALGTSALEITADWHMKQAAALFARHVKRAVEPGVANQGAHGFRLTSWDLSSFVFVVTEKQQTYQHAVVWKSLWLFLC